MSHSVHEEFKLAATDSTARLFKHVKDRTIPKSAVVLDVEQQSFWIAGDTLGTLQHSGPPEGTNLTTAVVKGRVVSLGPATSAEIAVVVSVNSQIDPDVPIKWWARTLTVRSATDEIVIASQNPAAQKHVEDFIDRVLVALSSGPATQ